MKQQINLYVKRESVKVPFSATTCLLILVVLTLGLTAINFLEQNKRSQAQQQLTQMQQQKTALQQQLNKLRAANKPKPESAELLRQVDRLKQQLSQQQRFGELLARLAPQQQGLFSSLLTGLSEQALEGVWLSRIQTSDNGRRVSLQGYTGHAELVPKYLKQLGDAPAYRGAQFDQFELGEAQQGLSFKVSGTRAGGEADG
ncbi:hypothetical protein DV711_14660 [Motiliproteus coralliicola]|uniref:MSHA biogenesis protein MshI n=1 Tax=Motiliproteus coralliicola TaxID=2283196 RepID=A0A369WE15_9GAMM|nr:PilN domain-containing protein [Motiliproteus coralliicola]RDE18856.1 hypothetical protein DV711_14660 [Motiliproteus coralliicola]